MKTKTVPIRLNTPSKGYVKIPAAPRDPPCPKCRAQNADRQHHVYRVADNNGLHFECDCCNTHWRIGRAYCERCQKRRDVIFHPDVTELRCPACNELTVLGAVDE